MLPSCHLHFVSFSSLYFFLVWKLLVSCYPFSFVRTPSCKIKRYKTNIIVISPGSLIFLPVFVLFFNQRIEILRRSFFFISFGSLLVFSSNGFRRKNCDFLGCEPTKKYVLKRMQTTGLSSPTLFMLTQNYKNKPSHEKIKEILKNAK